MFPPSKRERGNKAQLGRSRCPFRLSSNQPDPTSKSTQESIDSLQMHPPQPIPQIMPLIHNHPLPLLLHLLRAHLQRPNQANLLLPLRRHGHHLARLKLVLRIRQSPTGGSQTGRHERRAGEDEADRAAVDPDGGEGVGEGVEETQVWYWRAVVGLVEEGVGVDCVEGCSVGSVYKPTKDICQPEAGTDMTERMGIQEGRVRTASQPRAGPSWAGSHRCRARSPGRSRRIWRGGRAGRRI